MENHIIFHLFRYVLINLKTFQAIAGHKQISPFGLALNHKTN